MFIIIFFNNKINKFLFCLFKIDPFFNSEALEKINLELISPNKQDQNSAFNSHHNPSYIKDQKSDFVNPNINDKIDQLRKQNDYLFICKHLSFLFTYIQKIRIFFYV
jgi:hypothetical protein